MKKVIIIGGGVSGLSAGIFALKSGFDVTVYERGFVAGGNLTGWQRGDCHIDNCLHWLTGTNPNTNTYKDWVEVGMLGEVEVEYPKTLYTYSFGTRKLSLSSDLSEFKENLHRISPLDEKEINSFISAVETVEGITGIYGEEHDEKFSIAKILRRAPALLKYHSMTTKEFSKRFVNPFLRRFFVSFLGEDFSALALIGVFSTFCGHNGGVPKGGSLAAAKRMEERFKNLGGEIIFGKEAVKVTGGENPSVYFSDGEVKGCDYAILTGDAKSIFGNIVDAKMPKRLENMYKNPKMKRFSSVHVAFSVKGEVPFKGDYIIDVPSDKRKVINYPYLVLREFSFERSFAPKGETVVTAMAFLSEEQSKDFISAYAHMSIYKSIKRDISAAMTSLITEKFPSLKEGIKVIDCWTPATYRRYTGAAEGSYMSFIIPPKYIPVKISNRIKGCKNVIIASQWLLPPGGLPNALAAGKRAAGRIENLERAKRRALVYAKLKFSR